MSGVRLLLLLLCVMFDGLYIIVVCCCLFVLLDVVLLGALFMYVVFENVLLCCDFVFATLLFWVFVMFSGCALHDILSMLFCIVIVLDWFA